MHLCASPPTPSDDADMAELAVAVARPPPDGGYGWVCVATCFTINCFTWGTVSVSQIT
jgi:hypothetical protein